MTRNSVKSYEHLDDMRLLKIHIPFSYSSGYITPDADTDIVVLRISRSLVEKSNITVGVTRNTMSARLCSSKS